MSFHLSLLQVVASCFMLIDAIYHLNPNPLSRDDAMIFCNKQCNSTLAIVSDADYEEIHQLMSVQNISRFGTSFPIWIGNNAPTCTQLDANNNDKPDYCNKKKPFLCQSCPWSILSKYIIISDGTYSYDQANQQCASKYGTKLADVTNDDSEAKLLGGLYSQYYDSCWVSVNSESQDGLIIDNSTIDNSTCAELFSNTLDETDCSKSLPVVCNAKNTNEFCDQSRWTNIAGDWRWNASSCTVKSPVFEGLENVFKGTSIRLNRFAGYQWNAMTVEHVFYITNIWGPDCRSVIVFNINDGSSISMGINLRNDETRSFLAKLSANVSIGQRINAFGNGYDPSIEYRLKVMLSGEGVISLYVNGILYLSKDLNDRLDGNQLLPLNYYIEAIKVKILNMETYSKSLFINGEKMPYIYTSEPTMYPTKNPTDVPTLHPTYYPSNYPTKAPTDAPTLDPTMNPTKEPTAAPTISTFNPSYDPTTNPSSSPSNIPTVNPTYYPTFFPTADPTAEPTSNPSSEPTLHPTIFPTKVPSHFPTLQPTFHPTYYPSLEPTLYPTFLPSVKPTLHPSFHPTLLPSLKPSVAPSVAPTLIVRTSTSVPTAVHVAEPTQSQSVDAEIVNNPVYVGNNRKLQFLEWIIIAMLGCCCIIFGLIAFRETYKTVNQKTTKLMVANLSHMHEKPPAGQLDNTIEIDLNPVPS